MSRAPGDAAPTRMLSEGNRAAGDGARLPRRHRALAWLCLAAGVGAAALAVDGSVTRLAAELPRSIVSIAEAVTNLGTSLYIHVTTAAIAGAALLLARRAADRRVRLGLYAVAQRAAYVFAAVALSGIAAQLVKHAVGRARPKLIDLYGPYHLDLFAIHARNASFPSGHATTAFAAATAIGLLWPRGRPWLAVLASLIGLSRIVLRAHYVSDMSPERRLAFSSRCGWRGCWRAAGSPSDRQRAASCREAARRSARRSAGFRRRSDQRIPTPR